MRPLILIIAFCLIQGGLFAQEAERVSKFSVYANVGPSLYLNNFDKFKQFVEPWGYRFSAKIMWEPRSKISIGFKTGYYSLYNVNFNGKNEGHFNLSAIPIQTAFEMKLYKAFYAHFGMGPSIYFNKITTNKGDLLNSTFLSLADISAGFGYLQRPSKKMTFGAELEYFHGAKSEENLMSLSLVMRLPL